MTSSNLAIVIGPNILRKDGLDPMRSVTDNDSIVDVVKTLIDQWEEVYPGDTESERLAFSTKSSQVFGMSIASKKVSMGFPVLSDKSSSNSKQSGSVSFADRFKKNRDQGIYGMPAFSSFVSGPPPSFLSGSGPSPPGPPPNLKAVSQPRPSFRKSSLKNLPLVPSFNGDLSQKKVSSDFATQSGSSLKKISPNTQKSK